jgi:MAPEG family
MNCVENLPVYTALVVALMATGLQGFWIDRLCVGILLFRVGQSMVHILLPSTSANAGLRFVLFALQIISMVSIGVTIVTHAI